MMYMVKTPWWLKKLYPSFVWKILVQKKELFLTFDDGPHETATPFILNELKKYNAHATFFCIGKNVEQLPGIFNRTKDEGHAIGNHTYNHPNGWKTTESEYIANVDRAQQVFMSCLFRPPYGRIKRSQARQINKQYKIIMWDVLSGDFDVELSPEQCLQNVIKHTVAGSIIVFHDSQKAFEKVQYALPGVLKYFSEKGYKFSAIPV